MIIVISGPGGVGKGTVVRELIDRDERLWLSRSWTTRQRRDGESADAYVFATMEEFAAKAQAGGFVEHVEFLDYRQGSPVPDPPDGHDTVFEVDVHGARQLLDRFDDVRLVFIDAPTREEQEARLRGRGESAERVEQRLAKASDELEVALGLGAVLVVNDRLDETVEELAGLINSWRTG
jgi:guanylate kinase